MNVPFINKIFVLVLISVFFYVNGEKCGIADAKSCLENCECWRPCTDNDTLAVDCSRKKLQQLPSEWPNHSSHLIASFAHNSIGKLRKIPSTNARTVALTFKNCSLKYLENDLFIDAINIEYLDLSWNFLEAEDIPAGIFRGRYNNEIYDPIGLLELDLSHNRIQSLDPKIFEHTPKVNKLDLSSNPLKFLNGSTWEALTSLSSLSWLNLSNTSIISLPKFNEFSTPPIVYLDLSGNKITTVPSLLTIFSHSLEKLDLSGNPIIEINDRSFIGLSLLWELKLSKMPNLRNIKHNSFAGLTHLRTLHLSYNNKLSHIYEDAFGQGDEQPPLVEVYMNNNNLRELSNTLFNWSEIPVLHLEGNHWACECEKPPCTCPLGIIQNRNLPIDVPDKGSSLFIAIIIPIGLFVSAGLFIWRILIRNRRHRVVNSMYPVVYVSAPVAPPQ